MFNWILNNKEWLFSGIGVTVLLVLVWLVRSVGSLLRKSKERRFQQNSATQSNNNASLSSKLTNARTQHGVAASNLDGSSRSSDTSKKENVEIRVRDGNQPVDGVIVIFGHSDGTYQKGETDASGRTTIPKPKSLPLRVLAAHPDFLASLEEHPDAVQLVNIQLQQKRGTGSIICFGTGYIPGLQGRLNPILDTINRTYIYADNIVIEGGQRQPASFSIGKPFRVEDRSGSKFDLTVLEFVGRVSLIEYTEVH